MAVTIHPVVRQDNSDIPPVLSTLRSGKYLTGYNTIEDTERLFMYVDGCLVVTSPDTATFRVEKDSVEKLHSPEDMPAGTAGL